MITNYNLKYPAIKSKLTSKSETEHTLAIEPLLPGFGQTLGNSLRRIMLSSVPGFAVTKVRINDLTHEYQSIEKVKEDALDVLLNLKGLRANIETDDEKATLTLKKNKEGEVTAKDFEKNAGVEVVNKDLYICYLNKGGSLEIEVELSRGVGYVPYEKRDLKGNTDPKGILIDAVFTPVKNVALEIEQVRVGDQTNFDRINLSFDTDGSVEASEVVDFVLKLSVNMFSNIYSSFQSGEGFEKIVEATAETKTGGKEASKMSDNDEIELPPRIKKILEKNGITTNKELKDRIDEVPDFAGIAEKAIEKINEYLKNLK